MRPKIRNLHPEGRRPPKTTSFINVQDTQGFIKSRTPGKLTGYGDDFGRLVWPSRGNVSYHKVQLRMFCQPVKTACCPDENINKVPKYAESERACVKTVHITHLSSTLGGVEPSVLLEPPLPIDSLSSSCSYAASVSNRVSRSKSWTLGDGGGEAEWLPTSEIAASRILRNSNWPWRKKNVNTFYTNYRIVSIVDSWSLIRLAVFSNAELWQTTYVSKTYHASRQTRKCLWSKKYFCLFERHFKVKKNGVFLFGISFFILEIFTFLCHANGESDDVINSST